MKNKPIADCLDDWLVHISNTHRKGIKLGLDRTAEVFQKVKESHTAGLSKGASAPQTPLVITFAGTNGKGSTLAIVEALALATGKTVGAYCSPHLIRFNERIRINGAEATDDLIVSGFSHVERVRGAIPLTYFEFTTLAAFDLFLRFQPNIWLLEVGLGGRLDAVNIIDPAVAVITSVDLDHQAWLGNTREQIGFEKAGIIRHGIPVVLGSPDMPQSVHEKAASLSADSYLPAIDFALQGRRFVSERRSDRPERLVVDLQTIPDLPPNNVATALQVARIAGLELRFLEALSFPRLALRGRFQVAGREPLIVLDVAHNPHAAQYLSSWLTKNPVTGPDIAVFSALADKDISGVVRVLADKFQQWHLFQIDDPRAVEVGQLKIQVEKDVTSPRQRYAGSDKPSGYKASGYAQRSHATALICAHPHASSALFRAKLAAGKHGRILVFGSFMTVAAIIETGMIAV